MPHPIRLPSPMAPQPLCLPSEEQWGGQRLVACQPQIGRAQILGPLGEKRAATGVHPTALHPLEAKEEAHVATALHSPWFRSPEGGQLPSKWPPTACRNPCSPQWPMAPPSTLPSTKLPSHLMEGTHQHPLVYHPSSHHPGSTRGHPVGGHSGAHLPHSSSPLALEG